MAKLLRTDFSIYEKLCSGLDRKWKDSKLPCERSTSYSRQYPGANADTDKLSKDKALRSSFANRNGNIIGNSYALIEQDTNFRKSFAAPEKATHSRGLSRHESHISVTSSTRDLKTKNPYGYRSTLDGKSAYTSAFVDHGVKHCHRH